MAYVKVTKSDTFETWRQKTNELGVNLGDYPLLYKNATVNFTGISGQPPALYAGATVAVFSITASAGVYSVSAITTAGLGYSVGDVIRVYGSDLGGIITTNDLLITVATDDGSTGIATVTVSGTAASNLQAEVNLIRDEVGSATLDLTTSAADIKAAINELDLRQGDDVLITTATDMSAALNELKTATNTLGAITAVGMGTTASLVADAIVEVGDLARDAQAELGGDMLTGYAGNSGGGTARVLQALNSLHAASSLSTLDEEYLKRDGTNSIDAGAYLNLSEKGVTPSDGAELVLNTMTGTTKSQRLRIDPTTGNIGINKAPIAGARVDVSGVVKATSFNESGTTLSTKYAAKSSANILSGDNTFNGSVTLSPSVGKSVVIGGSTVATSTINFLEWFQDTASAMFDSSGDLTKSYNDTTGKISFAVDNNSHSHAASNITDWAEAVTDTVGSMIAGNTESGLNVLFDDATNKLNISITGGTAITTDADGVSVTNNGITADQLNVSGDGTALQFLRSDADGSFSWAVPVDINTTYSTSVPTGTTNLRLSSSAGVNDDVQFVGTNSVSVTRINDSKLSVNHLTTAGHKHIPTGGAGGKYLTYSASGAAVWSADTFDADVADKVTAMVTSVNTENGISVSVDVNDKLSFDVNDPTITLTGDVTGSVVMNNLGSVSMVTTVANASHTHPFSNITGTIATAQYGTGTITAAALAADSVGASEIAANAVGNSELATNAVAQINVADDAIGSPELKSVQTFKLYNSAGTVVKTLYGAGA